MSGSTSLCSPGPSGTVADRVFRALRQEIVEGRIAAGSKISEPELSRAQGVSRGALREALGRLESCGLVERRPNLGARVVELSTEQLLEIYLVREALEGMAARLAAVRMDPDQVAELRRLLERHREQIREDPNNAYFQQEGDLDFHYRIVQGSANGRLIRLLCNDLYQLVRAYRFQFGMASRRGPQAFGEHEHIVGAIERGDSELAELLMRHHIRASRENVERLLAESGQSPAKGGVTS